MQRNERTRRRPQRPIRSHAAEPAVRSQRRQLVTRWRDRQCFWDIA